MMKSSGSGLAAMQSQHSAVATNVRWVVWGGGGPGGSIVVATHASHNGEPVACAYAGTRMLAMTGAVHAMAAPAPTRLSTVRREIWFRGTSGRFSSVIVHSSR